MDASRADVATAVKAGAPNSFPDIVESVFDYTTQQDRTALVYHLRTNPDATKVMAVFAIGCEPCHTTVKVKDGIPTCQSKRCESPTRCVHARACA